VPLGGALSVQAGTWLGEGAARSAGYHSGPMPGDPQTIEKVELFAALAEGRAAGVTVVTPNRRLAQVLKAELDAAQAARGLEVWEDADILPFDAFLARCHEEARYAAPGEALPELLSPAQSRAVWEAAIRGSRWAGALLDVPQAAARAQEAWRLAQAWGIAGALEKFDGTEDNRAFADWARAYARELKKHGWIDQALLPGLDLAGKFKVPALLVAYGFDILPAQTRAFLERFDWRACRPHRGARAATQSAFASPRAELEAAARWARARLEEGKARIGVVVPDLKLRRKEVARVFARVLRPDCIVPGAPRAALPFELSAGEPLADYPLVAFALQLLEFAQREKPLEEVSRLIRSPFLAGAEREAAARARLDVRLRQEAGAELSLPRLVGLVEGCPVLRQRLERVFALKADRQAPQAWAQHYTALLQAAGFPGERGIDSAEYQAQARFNEVLGEFARLSAVRGAMSGGEALAALRRLCAETDFQPEGPGAPVQVLGLIESVGLEFDALWVGGLHDGQWPRAARPDPFVPLALQRKAQVPEASAEASLAVDREVTEAWAGAAPEVRLTWPRREDDRELAPSPLLAGTPEAEVALPAPVSWRDAIFQARRSETFIDELAPPLAAPAKEDVRGGSSVLKDQSACPFRAWARHRLRARALESPEPGLDAMQRGNLLHHLMKGLWDELKTSAALAGDVEPALAKAAAAAVAKLELEGRFAELERQRLVRLGRDWLAKERERPPFEVAATEDKRRLAIGGLAFTGRIDRLDRLAGGGYALIDYKTGARVTANDWSGERPADPQLPLYAVTAPEEVTAIAFARLRPGDMTFSGFSESKDALPEVRQARSWSGLKEGWKAVLEQLAAGFETGDARVDPNNGLATCRGCDLQPFCRVHERLSALAGEEGDE
jgi:probable DNA repair protein